MFHVKQFDERYGVPFCTPTLRKENIMTYQEAITTVKNGGRVARAAWSNQNVNQVTDSNGKLTITSHKTVTIDAPYLATQEDMYANDWTSV